MRTSVTSPRHVGRGIKGRFWLRGSEFWDFDYVLVGAVFLVTLAGLAMVYSTARRLNPSDEFYFLKRQAMFAVMGVIAMAAVIAVDYRRWRDSSRVVYVATVLLLVAVLAPVGSNIKGHQAWFQLPGGFTIQPSEFAKFSIIIAVAGYLDEHRGELDAWRFAVVLVFAAVPLGLVFLQPDLGTALVIGVIVVGLLAVAGSSGRQLVVLALLVATAIYAVLGLGLLQQYQIDRFNVLTGNGNQTSAYNQKVSQQAIANGRLAGRGFVNGSLTQGSFVPEQHTDFIFTAVGEEFGFVGAASLLGLFGLIMWRIWRTARFARGFFATLVCTGVLVMLAFQIFENVGMTMGIMPVAGIPLPFVSYGGSSLIASFASVGLVVRISMRRFA